MSYAYIGIERYQYHKQNRSRTFDSNGMWLHPKGIQFPVKVTSNHHTEEKHTLCSCSIYISTTSQYPFSAVESLEVPPEPYEERKKRLSETNFFGCRIGSALPPTMEPPYWSREKQLAWPLFFCTTPSLTWTDMLSAELLAPKCGYLSGFTLHS